MKNFGLQEGSQALVPTPDEACAGGRPSRSVPRWCGGEATPTTIPSFQAAMQALYSLSWTIKMLPKEGRHP